MKDIITNYNVYDLEQTLVASGYAMIEDYSEQEIIKEQNNLILDIDTCAKDENRHVKRALKLSKAPLNSGHVIILQILSRVCLQCTVSVNLI